VQVVGPYLKSKTFERNKKKKKKNINAVS